MEIISIAPKPKEKKLVRVAAYARVSSDKDAAFRSAEAQRDYYEKYVALREDWELVGIFSDEGISGTKIERPGFQAMLKACRKGKVDLVVTKSITRFARNTVDLLTVTRELKSLHIDVFFEKEDMHTISPDGELLLTLLAMYAEEEARSASENQLWRIKRKFEKGETTVGKMMGYRLREGKLIVVPKEAEIVRRIFHDYLAGVPILRIAKNLNVEKVPAPHCAYWTGETVRNILTNEKYTGNMLLQKTFAEDFRTKKRKVNHGEKIMYSVKGSHEPIISPEMYESVQQKFKETVARKENSKISEPPRLFSGILRCMSCKGAYIRITSNTGKHAHPVWSCRHYNNMTKSACSSRPIPEKILVQKVREVLAFSDSTPLTNELLKQKLEKIIVKDNHTLEFVFKNGEAKDVCWEFESRSKSWTPEMRQKARERAIEQRRKEREKNES